MSSGDELPARETVGTITGVKGNGVVVQLSDGTEVLCRSATRLHRPLGFFQVPVGRIARIRFHPTKSEKMPLILEVLSQ